MEPTTPTQTDMPESEAPAPASAPAPAQDPAPQVPQDTPSEPVETETVPSETATVGTATVTAPETEDSEEEYPSYQPVPPVAPIDFSQLPVDENNLIDPNALAQQINGRIAQAEQNAAARAQQIYAEQEQEKRLWDKAYEKHPDLKTNKELRDMVHNARLGRVTELLSQNTDGKQIKMPTPAQMADTLFKHISSAKSEGFTQANQNTQVQQSAVLETSGPARDSSGDVLVKARADLKNPNKEVRTQAANKLLKNFLGWE